MTAPRIDPVALAWAALNPRVPLPPRIDRSEARGAPGGEQHYRNRAAQPARHRSLNPAGAP